MTKLKDHYEKIYQHAPLPVKRALKRATGILLGKPTFKEPPTPREKRFPGKEKGGLVLSADFELAWAWRFARGMTDPLAVGIQKARIARENFPFLLKTLTSLDIPITWATVGHLFLENCKEGDHDWMRRIPYFDNSKWSFRRGDWFDADPYSNLKQGPAWYAPDLVELIKKAKPKHDIGCHTFSHMDCSDQNCPAEVLVDELEACKQAAHSFDIQLSSFVFPAGTSGNYPVLKKKGLTVFRQKHHTDLGFPEITSHGLVRLPSSMGLDKSSLSWSETYHFKVLKKYIDKAMQTGTLCHFWFHPSFDPQFLQGVFKKILTYGAQKREEGSLWIGTMTDAARLIPGDSVLDSQEQQI